MIPADIPEPASSERLREALMAAIEDCCSGRMAVEDLVVRVGDLLKGLPLTPSAEIMKFGVEAGDRLDKNPAIALDLTLRLVSSDHREVRALAAATIFRLARYQPGIWVDTARHLVTDDDWEVRDLAAHVFDTRDEGEGAAEFHLEFVREAVAKWVKDPEYLVRRAAAQSLTGYAIKHPDFIRPLLEILAPLIEDDREYVRRAVAATLRSLGRVDANAIFEFAESSSQKITRRSSEVFRLTLANAFAEKQAARRASILSRLVQ